MLDEAGLSIRHQRGEDPSPDYVATGARPARLRVFLDYGSIEVFADHGRWTGTKRIDGFEPVRSARLRAAPGIVSHATIWALRP
uniref:CAZy families GH32 protein n=1 Tax=uncultured Agrobacterium sp. TaxID=157277 RepID=A0A060BWT4_9HYPH|nr:CAZy families GH32 protein [uncultured Agrobacterium sp.]